LYATFLFVGHDSATFSYANNVKLSHIKLFQSDLRRSEAYLKRNELDSLSFKFYLYETFLFNGHASDTFSYAKNVKLSHIKLFRCDLRKSEAYLKRNELYSLSFACYLYVTFLYIGHASDTFRYAENVKLSHVKLPEQKFWTGPDRGLISMP